MRLSGMVEWHRASVSLESPWRSRYDAHYRDTGAGWEFRCELAHCAAGKPRGDVGVPRLLPIRLTAIPRLFVVPRLFGAFSLDQPVGQGGEVLVAQLAWLVERGKKSPHLSRVDLREVEMRLLVLQRPGVVGGRLDHRSLHPGVAWKHRRDDLETKRAPGAADAIKEPVLE